MEKGSSPFPRMKIKLWGIQDTGYLFEPGVNLQALNGNACNLIAASLINPKNVMAPNMTQITLVI